MTGRVIKVLAAPGDKVTKNAPLLVIEAMKMEHDLNAPISGQIDSLDVQVGQLVEQGQSLGHITPEDNSKA
jgi:biotin carboxyl carrier protein